MIGKKKLRMVLRVRDQRLILNQLTRSSNQYFSNLSCRWEININNIGKRKPGFVIDNFFLRRRVSSELRELSSKDAWGLVAFTIHAFVHS
jgi:hypothetical protein